MALVAAGSILKRRAAEQVSDRQLETASFRFPYNTPSSKEAYLYREIFEELFRYRARLNAFLAVFRRMLFSKSD